MSAGHSASSARATVAWSAPSRQRLAHMRDVEQPGGGARVQVLGEDAGGILHRHVVAGERHHARAERDMQRMQRRAWQSDAFGDSRASAIGTDSERALNAASHGFAAGCDGAPSVPGPERFPRAEARLPPSVGARLTAPAAFQSVIPSAVLWPERFRGGCAFGAGSYSAPPVSSAGGLCLTPASKPEAGGFVNSGRPRSDVSCGGISALRRLGARRRSRRGSCNPRSAC